MKKKLYRTTIIILIKMALVKEILRAKYYFYQDNKDFELDDDDECIQTFCKTYDTKYLDNLEMKKDIIEPIYCSKIIREYDLSDDDSDDETLESNLVVYENNELNRNLKFKKDKYGGYRSKDLYGYMHAYINVVNKEWNTLKCEFVLGVTKYVNIIHFDENKENFIGKCYVPKHKTILHDAYFPINKFEIKENEIIITYDCDTLTDLE